MEDRMEITQKTERRTTNDTAIPLLGICLEVTKTEKDTCAKCSLQHYLQQLGHRSNLDIQEEDVVHIYNEYYSAIKGTNLVSSSEVDKPRACYTV